jgi:hypothetical protein
MAVSIPAHNTAPAELICAIAFHTHVLWVVLRTGEAAEFALM